MINALYEPFPESITVDGTEYPIITDFREWFRFADLVEDDEISKRDKLYLMMRWFLKPPERITDKLIYAILDFYRARELERERPESSDDEDNDTPPPSVPVLNWKIDAPFIIGDFLRYYGIDLLTAEMHWWHFRLLFSALPAESQMMTRIGYRGVDLGLIKNESERKRVMKMKQLYALPFELDEDDIAAVFGGGL